MAAFSILHPSAAAARFSNRQQHVPFFGQAGTGPETFGAAFVLEGDFDFVRVLHANFDTTAAYTSVASVAPSASMGDGANPVNASGAVDQTLHVPVTYNGGAGGSEWPSPAGTVRQMSHPAAVQLAGSNAAQLTISPVASDWMPCTSLPRLDGGTGRLLFTRMAPAGSSTSINVGAQPQALSAGPGKNPWDAVAQGRGVVGWYAGGDQATAPGAVTPTYGPFFAPMGVEVISRQRGMTILAIGDSLTEGAGTATTQDSPWQQAAWSLSTPSFPVSVVKAGYPGQMSSVFQANGAALMKLLVPDVAIIKTSSPNDPNNGAPATFAASLGRAMALVRQAVNLGCIPVLLTEFPFGYTGAAEAARQAHNATVRSLGYPVIDADAVLADPMNPSMPRPAFISTSAPPHYGDAGAVALGRATAEVLGPIMSAAQRG